MKKKVDSKRLKVFNEVCAYLGGDLDSPMCREIREHLESCTGCAEYIDSVKRTVMLYRKHEGCLEAPADCKDRILKSIRLAVKEKKK